MRLQALTSAILLALAACGGQATDEPTTTQTASTRSASPTTTLAAPTSTSSRATTSTEPLDLESGVVVVDDEPFHPWSWSDEYGIPRDDFIPWGVDLDPDGYPVMAYFVGISTWTDADMSHLPQDVFEALDAMEGEVRLARCLDFDCTDGFEIRHMPFDPRDLHYMGEFALTNSGAPVFMWLGNLVVCSDALCTSWNRHSFEGAGSEVLVAGDVAAIIHSSFGDAVEAAALGAALMGDPELRLTVCIGPTCEETAAITLDEGDVCRVNASVDNAGRLRVVYLHLEEGVIKSATCGDLTCSSGTQINTITEGRDPILVVSEAGDAVWFEKQDSSGASIALCQDLGCTDPEITDTAVEEHWKEGPESAMFNAPYELEVITDLYGVPTVAWARWDYDLGNWYLSVTTCEDRVCSNSMTFDTLIGMFGMQNNGLFGATTRAGRPLFIYDEADGDQDTMYLGLVVCTDSHCSILDSEQ